MEKNNKVINLVGALVLITFSLLLFLAFQSVNNKAVAASDLTVTELSESAKTTDFLWEPVKPTLVNDHTVYSVIRTDPDTQVQYIVTTAISPNGDLSVSVVPRLEKTLIQ